MTPNVPERITHAIARAYAAMRQWRLAGDHFDALAYANGETHTTDYCDRQADRYHKAYARLITAWYTHVDGR